jgi:hypothetical protein
LLFALFAWPLIKDGLEIIYENQMGIVLAGKEAIFPFSIIRLQEPWEGLYQSPGHFKMYYFWLLNLLEVGIYLYAASFVYRKVRSQLRLTDSFHSAQSSAVMF